MASRSTKGGRPGSPVKKSSTTINANRTNDASVSGLYHNEDFSQADVVRGLTEREVEIDHLKTTCFALNEQVQVGFAVLFIINRLSMTSSWTYVHTSSFFLTQKPRGGSCRFTSRTPRLRSGRTRTSTPATRSS